MFKTKSYLPFLQICLLPFMMAVLPMHSACDQVQQSSSQPAFVIQPLRIPMKAANPNGLEALLIRPNEPGRHPLAVMTHGTPATAAERPAMTPQRMLPLAMEFARRGWTTVIVMRRGYGTSGGQYAEDKWSCDNPDYMDPAMNSARDLRAAITYLSTLPEVDPARILAIGASGGGLAVIALTVNPPPGLVVAINFAGGRGYVNTETFCHAGNLLSTFWLLGKQSRVPMLWVYAKNDHFFPAELAESLYREFTTAGGHATFIAAPPFGDEGHNLFTMTGIPVWTRYVDSFLNDQKLVVFSHLLPLPEVPRVHAPQELSSSGQKAFHLYLAAPTEKAFAVNATGRWGYEYGSRTSFEAKKTALERCQTTDAQGCRIVMVNNRTAIK
jgi:dienelactone hydrolase